MSKKRNLDRERAEVIFMHILMRFMPYLLIAGGLLLTLSLSMSTFSPGSSLVGIMLSLLFLLPFFSFQFILYTAKTGAWLFTIGKR